MYISSNNRARARDWQVNTQLLLGSGNCAHQKFEESKFDIGSLSTVVTNALMIFRNAKASVSHSAEPFYRANVIYISLCLEDLRDIERRGEE